MWWHASSSDKHLHVSYILSIIPEASPCNEENNFSSRQHHQQQRQASIEAPGARW
jgi:hypothetical protein